MDVMQAFRSSAKPLIFIVAISFFAWLVLDLSGLSGGTGLLTTTSVGKINGRSVDSRLFQQAVSQATEERQRQAQQPLGIAEVAQIRDQVWEQFIQDRLLDQEYRRYGIDVGADEIAAAIRSSPPAQLQSLPDFQTDGQFDQTKYERWLASSVGQTYVPVLENQYRTQILQAKLARHLTAALYTSDPELWERYRDQNESVKVGVATVDPATAVADSSITVTPSEVESYYQSKRETLKREQTAYLSYLVLDRRTNAADSAAALDRTNRIRGEIAGGVPFAEVARRESSDTVSGNRGGDLGEWSKGSFDPDFEKTAFSIPLNTLSAPVLTRFGYHLIEVTKRDGNKASGRHILIPIEISGAHRDLLDAKADSLEQLGAERLDPAALDTTSRALGLPVQRTGPVVKNAASLVPPDAAIWAFQAKAGEHSPVIESPTAYLLFRLDSVQAAGVPPLEAARAEIEGRLREQKKKTEAKKLAGLVLQQATASGSLEQAAKSLQVPYSLEGPFTRLNAPLQGGAAVGAAFGLNPGELSQVVEGREPIYVLQGSERIRPDSAGFTKTAQQLRDQAIQNARALFLRQYMTALRADAKIVDSRDRIYKTVAQAEADAPPPPGQLRP
jgi:peptidyl-prolyl cis-trans isomerase D